jgi:hypothetical protein
MPDFLDVLARDAKATIESGYYEHFKEAAIGPISLRKAIQQVKTRRLFQRLKGLRHQLA